MSAHLDRGRRIFAKMLDTLRWQQFVRNLGGQMNGTELEVWTTPDFVEYETPMEVTAYAARMED
jgi:coenzyme PQQ precursor peptide PqqA